MTKILIFKTIISTKQCLISVLLLAVTGNNTYYCLKWSGIIIVENSTGKKKSSTFVLPRSDPCIHREARAKLSV